jgi:hypothetical protein
MGQNGHTNGLGKRVAMLEYRRLEAARKDVVPVDLLEPARQVARLLEIDEAGLLHCVRTMALNRNALRAAGWDEAGIASIFHLTWLGMTVQVSEELAIQLATDLADQLETD